MMLMLRHEAMEVHKKKVRKKDEKKKSNIANLAIIIINTNRDYVQQLNAINGIIKPVKMLDNKLTL